MLCSTARDLRSAHLFYPNSVPVVVQRSVSSASYYWQKVGLADELISDELLEDALVNWVIQDLVCLENSEVGQNCSLSNLERQKEYKFQETVRPSVLASSWMQGLS